MNKFKEASVHELINIIQFVDTKALNTYQLDFLRDWASDDDTEINRLFHPWEIIQMLSDVEDKLCHQSSRKEVSSRRPKSS